MKDDLQFAFRPINSLRDALSTKGLQTLGTYDTKILLPSDAKIGENSSLFFAVMLGGMSRLFFRIVT
jgi:hypothetical protein